MNAEFEVFWKAYPKKRSKGDAEKVWRKINPDTKLLQKMLSTIEKAKQTWDWRKEKGQYIPYPATWLNAKGWEDELFVPTEHTRHIRVEKKPEPIPQSNPETVKKAMERIRAIFDRVDKAGYTPQIRLKKSIPLWREPTAEEIEMHREKTQRHKMMLLGMSGGEKGGQKIAPSRKGEGEGDEA